MIYKRMRPGRPVSAVVRSYSYLAGEQNDPRGVPLWIIPDGGTSLRSKDGARRDLPSICLLGPLKEARQFIPPPGFECFDVNLTPLGLSLLLAGRIDRYTDAVVPAPALKGKLGPLFKEISISNYGSDELKEHFQARIPYLLLSYLPEWLARIRSWTETTSLQVSARRCGKSVRQTQRDIKRIIPNYGRRKRPAAMK